jgi:8-oxo-dGTP diphosphatase
MKLVVAAAVIEDHGLYFVTRRHKGVHLEGYWEFPGGKCGETESLEECLKRELLEELAVTVTVGPEIFTSAHDYPDRTVELHFFTCTMQNAPVALLGQEMKWVARDCLGALQFPPADDELIARLVNR